MIEPQGDAHIRDLIDDESLDTLLEILDAPKGCWGAELSGSVCTPSFAPGLGHFKNKFCTLCREQGIAIPAGRICMITLPMSNQFSNTNGRTVWTEGARLVNQTAKCTGSSVLIFKDKVPERIKEAVAPPDEWIRHDADGTAYVLFIVSKGTLVPQPIRTRAEPLSTRHLTTEPCSAHSMDETHVPPSMDRAALLNAQHALERLVSLRLDYERIGIGTVDDPLTEAETCSLRALLEALQDASRVLHNPQDQSDSQSIAMTLSRTLPSGSHSNDILSFPPSPPGSARPTARSKTRHMATQTEETQVSLPQATAWVLSLFILGVVSCLSAQICVSMVASRLSLAGQSVLTFVIGMLAFNLATFLTLFVGMKYSCLNKHSPTTRFLHASFPVWWWPSCLLSRQEWNRAPCLLSRHVRCSHTVSPSGWDASEEAGATKSDWGGKEWTSELMWKFRIAWLCGCVVFGAVVGTYSFWYQ